MESSSSKITGLTGYNYPDHFEQFLKDIAFDETLDKKDLLATEDCKTKSKTTGSNALWHELISEQKKRNNILMYNIWKQEKDEKLFRKCNFLKEMEQEILPTCVKSCLVCVKAAMDMGAHKLKKRTPFRPNLMLAEAMWNFNPHYPERLEKWHHLEDIPFFKSSLPLRPSTQVESIKSENKKEEMIKKPRMGRKQAATKIQSAFRGYLVRKTPEVMELRTFWKILALWKTLKVKEEEETLGKTPFRQFARKLFTERELEVVEFDKQKAYEEEILKPLI